MRAKQSERGEKQQRLLFGSHRSKGFGGRGGCGKMDLRDCLGGGKRTRLSSKGFQVDLNQSCKKVTSPL